MRTQDSGAIVNCSSLGGLVGLPGRAAHHASKQVHWPMARCKPSDGCWLSIDGRVLFKAKVAVTETWVMVQRSPFFTQSLAERRIRRFVAAGDDHIPDTAQVLAD
jgi:hypothetical protein